MRVIDIIDTAVVHAGIARAGAIPDDLFAHVLNLLNVEYHNLWHLYPWDEIKEFSVTVTTVAGIATLPNNVDVVRAVREDDNPFTPVHEIRVNNQEPQNFTDVGDTSRFMFIDPSPVLTQPSTPSVITVVSTSDVSTEIQTVRLEGVNDSTGKDDEEEIALNGTTPVPGSKVFRSLREVTKGLTVGRVALSGGGTVGDIAPWDFRGKYRRLKLVPLPVNEITLQIIANRKFERLVSDNDSIVFDKMTHALLDRLIARLKETEGELEQSNFYATKASDELEIMGRNEIEQNNRQIKATPAIGNFGDLDFPHAGMNRTF